MGRIRIKYLLALWLFVSCKHEPPKPIGSYPGHIGNIILNKCATSGCHDDKSHTGAGGLNLATWDKLFEGGYGGSVVIPYRPDFSTLCYYTNTDTSLGVRLEPTMPDGQSPLSRAEYLAIRDWIASGAPDARNYVKFADNPLRKKIYVANRLCDVVTVFDAQTMLQMRYIDVGDKQAQEFPHNIKVSPDKQHWYISFFSPTSKVQKFSAIDDRLISSIELRKVGLWTSFVVTHDSRYGFFVDNSNPGRIVYVDLESNTVLANYGFDNKLVYPQGIAINESLHKIYVGTSSGNFIYSIEITDPLNPVFSQIPVDGTTSILYNSVSDPVELICDGNKCYIACQKSKEIRVLDMQTNTLAGVIPLYNTVAAMSYSSLTKKLFVACPDDTLSFSGNRGSVIVINTLTNTVYKKIKSGYEPYGIAVDDEQKFVAVANANLNNGGPSPHHVSKCGGRNGNVSFIDLNTLELIPGKKSEVAVFPYSVSTR